MLPTGERVRMADGYYQEIIFEVLSNAKAYAMQSENIELTVFVHGDGVAFRNSIAPMEAKHHKVRDWKLEQPGSKGLAMIADALARLEAGAILTRVTEAKGGGLHFETKLNLKGLYEST
jgi:hypothetical protein